MRSLGRQFGWLWAAFAVSTFGTCLAFEAYPLIAIIVLHAGPAEVSVLAAAGRALGAAAAVSLGPWVEFRRKRRVMVAMDLIRFATVASVPVAFALDWLSFTQLLIVSMIGAAADIAFRAASGAYLKAVVQPEDLLVANGRIKYPPKRCSGQSQSGVVPDVADQFLQLHVPCCVLSAGIEHRHTGTETHMDTLTTKLAALAGTLFMNTLVMGAVAYCFALQPNTYMTAVALAKAVATQQGLG